MKPIDVKDNTYVDWKKEVNNKDPKVRFGDHGRISKYKNTFPKGYTPNWSEENYMSNGKFIIIHLIVGLIKKIWCDSNV